MLRVAGGDSAQEAREDNGQNVAVVEVVPRKDSFAAGLDPQQHILLRNDVGGVVQSMDYEETWNYSPDDKDLISNDAPLPHVGYAFQLLLMLPLLPWRQDYD